MLYPKKNDPKLSLQLFQNPDKNYRGVPFWSWNCKVTVDLIKEQIPIFKQMGMGGVTIHPRVGLDTQYLSDEFIDLVSFANEKVKEEDMFCVLYDEDNFPSGNAGGLVTKKEEYRARNLLLTQNIRTDFSFDKRTYEKILQEGGESKGYYLTSYMVTLEDGFLVDYKKLKKAAMGTEKEGTRSTKIWNLYLEVAPNTEDSPAYVDVMNPDAIQDFIKITHSTYAKALQKDFGKSIKAIFTDEPTITKRNLLPYPEYDQDTTLGYTDDFSDSYMEAFGIPFLDILPEILWELPDGETNFYRYAYNMHLTERFAHAYSDAIGAWCEKHCIAYTGHLLSERTLFEQSYRLGEAMRHYKAFHIPGIDILCGDLEFSTVKQAVSVARQYNREGVMSELYGVTNWDFDFKGHKLQGDWQAALGVTMRVHHLSYMSMEGEGKRDWPSSIFYQSPWFEKYSYIENHFARLNTALTRGKAIVKVAVIHPIESYWTILGNNAQTGLLREQMDEDFENIIRWLLYGLIDFDFISESLLPELYIGGTNGFHVGNMSYEVVLVPGLKTIRKTTLERLEAFIRGGGEVIFAGEIPYMVDARKSKEALELATLCSCIPFLKYNVLQALEKYRTVEIRREDGMRSNSLFYQLREDFTNQWLFVCHVTNKENNVDVEENYKIKLKGTWNPMLYDTLTGEVKPVPAYIEEGNTVIPFQIYGEDSILLKLTVEPPQCIEKERKEKDFKIVPIRDSKSQIWMELKRLYSYKLEEPNVLLIDKASYQLDGREWNPSAYILDIDAWVKKRLHYKAKQPYLYESTKFGHRVGLRIQIFSEVKIKKPVLALEKAQFATIILNGVETKSNETVGYYIDRFIQKRELPPMQKGCNVLEVYIPYGEKSFIEAMYLLGDFGVRIHGETMYITEKARRLEIGDITYQGFPFYGGNLYYEYKFAVDKPKALALEVPHFAAPLLEVFLDGTSKGLISFAPHRLDLGGVEEGGHILKIIVYGNRYNTLAALHNADKNYKWYGPMSYRTKDYQWTDSYCLKAFGILSRPRLLCKDVEPY